MGSYQSCSVLQNNAAISAGQWWRFVTPAFLHSGIVHMAINCYSLKNLGPFMESLTNKRRFVSVYAAGALGCTALSYLCSPLNSVGASGIALLQIRIRFICQAEVFCPVA